MKLATYLDNNVERVAVERNGKWFETDIPSILEALQGGALLAEGGFKISDRELDPEALDYLPVIPNGEKIICVGLNYADHADESPYGRPDFPTFFPRFSSSLVAHNKPILRSRASEQLDWEAELAVVIGKNCKNVPRSEALSYVAGYTNFNDASFRDYQFKGEQWTLGKNFDKTGALGPALVTAAELPAGAMGLKVQTRLNGQVMQDSSTSQLLFPVDQLIEILSGVMTLKPGDVIATGTPAGIGWARTPSIFMKQGDVCEVEIEGLGILRNTVVDEA